MLFRSDSDGQCGVYTSTVKSYIAALDSKVATNKAIQTAAATCQVDTGSQRSVQLDLSEERAFGYDTANLIQHIADRLLGGTISDDLKKTMTTALSTIVVPALNAEGTNGDAVNAALDQRVKSAILMVAVSPEFLILK